MRNQRSRDASSQFTGGRIMWRRGVSWCGAALIAVALAAIPAPTIVCSYLGGSTYYGFIENGRYDVGAYGRFAEVSESAWRFTYWLERAYPLLVLVPAAAGFFLMELGAPPGRRR